MIIVGLVLCPISIIIIFQLNKFNIKKSTRILLNAYLLVSSFLYIALTFILNIEPFQFNITSASDYIIYSAVIFLFSPFLWIHLYYGCKKLFKTIRVHKNAKIKSDAEYIYYRDDLDKIPPSLVMFTSIMESDIKKSISAVMLKLKLNGYIQEINKELIWTHKDDHQLLESEKIVLKALQSKNIDEKQYKKLVEKEALDYKYVKKNNSGKIVKLIKIMITLFIPAVIMLASVKFDQYVFNNYKTYLYDGIRYVSVYNGEIGDIHYDEIENIDDYYHGYVEIDNQKKLFYDKALIRADKFEYSIVRKTVILQNLDALFLCISIVMVFVMAFMALEQILYFNKNYIRTKKGRELLNKAYALKNYLKEFSLIKDRTQEELILWEYYLIYAVVLDVNIKIKDEIIENYFIF